MLLRVCETLVGCNKRCRDYLVVVNIKAGCSIPIDHTDSAIMTINYFLFNYRDSAISRNF